MKSADSQKKIKNKKTTDPRLKIRLGFDSAVGAHRQILVKQIATQQINLILDTMFDTNDNDMFWELVTVSL
jgi:hypothetical protein